MFKRKVGEPEATELTSLLETILAYLAKSEDSPWSEMDVSEARNALGSQLESLKGEGKINMRKLNYLFAPTAPLQEISMMSGWADEYLELSKKFDEYYEKYS